MDQIIKDDKQLSSHEEVMNYLVVLSDKKTDWTKPLWEFRVIENYKENASLILYKFHHCFMDGIGFASLLSCINDDQFTSKLNKRFEQPSIITKLKATYNGIKLLVNTLSSASVSITDENAIKIVETTREDRYPNRFYTSKEYDYSKIMKCYKQYPNMTFNDFAISILGKSYHQLYKEYEIKDANQLGIFILINMRPLPTKYEEVCLDNFFITCPLGMPLLDDINANYQLVKPSIDIFKTQEASYTCYYFFNLAVACLPKELCLKIFTDHPTLAHIYVSNVPISDVPIKMNGKEIKTITMNNTNFHGFGSGIIFYTYNGKVRFGMQNVNNLKFDSSKLLQNILTNIDEEISKVAK